VVFCDNTKKHAAHTWRSVEGAEVQCPGVNEEKTTIQLARRQLLLDITTLPQSDVREFKAAVSAFQATPIDSRIHTLAREIIVELAEKQVVYYVKCILCDNRFEYVTTVVKASAYTDTPRGICGNH
jgi:hypothetical protein